MSRLNFIRATTWPGVGRRFIRRICSHGYNRGNCQQEDKRQRNQKPSHLSPTVIQIPTLDLGTILMIDKDSVNELGLWR